MAQITKAKQPPRENRAEAVQTERRRRKEFGLKGRTRLGQPVPDDPNFVHRWVNDAPGRVQQMIEEDWDLVTRSETVADERETSAGTLHERHTGTDKAGKPVRGVLMRKPRDYYEHDKAAEQADLSKRMTAIKRGRTPDEQGQAIHDDGAYVPRGGIVIQENYKP